MKVNILTNMPTPYRLPLFEEIGKNCTQLSIYYCVGRESNRDWNVNLNSNFVTYKKLKNVSYRITKNKYIHLSLDCYKMALNSDVINVIGDASYNSYFLALILRCLRRKYVVWTGITQSSVESRVGWMLKKFMFNGAGSIVSYGTETEDLLIERGINKPIYNAYNSVDNDYYLNIKEMLSSHRPLNNRKNIVYVGQLIERKNILSLVRALSLTGRDDALILIGRGDELYINKIKQLAQDLKVNVFFKGVLPPLEIYEVYQNSDCLCLPSFDEPWGLVVNEAMLFGLPVIVSDKVGCRHDLINEQTGIVCGVDSESIAQAIVECLSVDYDPEVISNFLVSVSSASVSANAFSRAIYKVS